MKPRTRLQCEVIGNSQQLRDHENEMLSWAKVECLDHKGYAAKSRVICMDCGQKFSPDLVKRKRAICPHCNTKLTIELSRCRTDKQHTYFAIAEIYGEFQVIHNFELYAYYKVDKPAHYFIQEILQHWILPNGKREVVARNHSVNWYMDSWNGNMEIRKHYPKYYDNSGDKYDVYPHKYHPDSVFKAEYRRYGIDCKLQGLTFLEAIKLLPVNPKAETLLKAKQYQLLGYCQSHGYRIDRFWSSIRICMRNNYKVSDASIWIDYLELISYFQKDLHNAHYVCPKNLKKEHDRLVKKKRRIQELEKAERKKKKAAEAEMQFKELKECFFGIEFSDGPISVKVLTSVQDHVEEGDILHHCVFTNDYHLKPDSLILSATVDGVKAETIELSLSKLRVVQCRGKFNNNTECHDRIIKLVNKNKKLFRNRKKITA